MKTTRIMTQEEFEKTFSPEDFMGAEPIEEDDRDLSEKGGDMQLIDEESHSVRCAKFSPSSDLENTRKAWSLDGYGVMKRMRGLWWPIKQETNGALELSVGSVDTPTSKFFSKKDSHEIAFIPVDELNEQFEEHAKDVLGPAAIVTESSSNPLEELMKMMSK